MVDFDSLKPGQSATIHVEMSPDVVDVFTALTGDYNPIHTKGTVVHGMLTASYVSRLVGMELPGNGSVWTQQSFEWLQPVHIWDELDITLFINHVSTWTRGVSIGVEAKNQNGVMVMRGKGTVVVPRRLGNS